MPYVYNPLLKVGLDQTGAGGGASVAGSDTEIQYNDGGSLGASVDLTWDDTGKVLGVGGDIDLDDGGTYTTTLQTITPTAARTISFPDATGTVALVGGSSGQVLYNNAGAVGWWQPRIQRNHRRLWLSQRHWHHHPGNQQSHRRNA
jgi:hypothetical protein